METAIFKVEDMNCAHCANAINSELIEIDGIVNVDIELEEKQLKVEFDNNKLTKQEIVKAIKDLGFNVI